MAEIIKTIVIGKSSTLTERESLCLTISSSCQRHQGTKCGNSKQCRCSENGSDGERGKRSCASLGLCQGDGRCDDCPSIG